MPFGRLTSNARRFGAIAAPRLSRFGHTAASFLTRAGNAGSMLATRGAQVVDALDKTPLGANPEAAALFGGARALLRDVALGAGVAQKVGMRGEQALQRFDRTALPAAQKYLSSDFEKPRRA